MVGPKVTKLLSYKVDKKELTEVLKDKSNKSDIEML
jgi:hypothetical protein